MRSLRKDRKERGLPVTGPSPGQGQAKITLTVIPTQDVFIAGTKVTGSLELVVASEDVSLGDLGLEWTAYEGEWRRRRWQHSSLSNGVTKVSA